MQDTAQQLSHQLPRDPLLLSKHCSLLVLQRGHTSVLTPPRARCTVVRFAKLMQPTTAGLLLWGVWGAHLGFEPDDRLLELEIIHPMLSRPARQ